MKSQQKSHKINSAQNSTSGSQDITTPSNAAWRSADAVNEDQGAYGIALWRQIAEDLEADINTGRLAVGERLPSEAVMAKRFGVNRHTLRRATGELSRKGLLEATPGRGTFVCAPKLAYPIGQTTRFSEVIAETGQDPGGQLLRHDRIAVPAGIRDWLGLANEDEVIELEILRKADGIPICLTMTWFPAERFPDIATSYQRLGNITQALSDANVNNYSRFKTLISCRNADTNEREALDLGRGANLLVVDSINVDDRGTPIQVNYTRFAAERVKLTIEN